MTLIDKITPDKSDREMLFSAIDEFSAAMLTTQDSNGAPRARPMSILAREPGGRLWFASREQTGKVNEIAMDSDAGVIMQSDDAFVSMTGTCSLLRDADKAEELWKPQLKPWFPDGPRDPALTLIRFDPTEAEVWRSDARTAIPYAFEAVKAAAKGEKMDPPSKSHAEVSLP
jgi:general stress protein 26